MRKVKFSSVMDLDALSHHYWAYAPVLTAWSPLYCVTRIINLDLPLLIFSIVNCMPIFRAWRCAILHLLHLLMSLHQTHMWWLSCLTTQSVSIYTMNFLIGDTYEQLVHPWTPALQQYYNPQTRQKKPFYNLYVTVRYRCEGNKKSLELTPICFHKPCL